MSRVGTDWIGRIPEGLGITEREQHQTIGQNEPNNQYAVLHACISAFRRRNTVHGEQVWKRRKKVPKTPSNFIWFSFRQGLARWGLSDGYEFLKQIPPIFKRRSH